MSGIFGIFAFDEIWRVSKFVYYGLLALQTRGQEVCGIACGGSDGIVTCAKRGYVDQSFKENELEGIGGWYGIGYVGADPQNVQPVTVRHNGITVSVCYSGRIFNLRELTKRYNLPEKENESILFAKILASEVRKSGPMNAAALLMEELEGVYTVLAITDQKEMVAFRDSHGVKPLTIGSYGFDYGAIASESAGLEVIGADYKSDIMPGEIYLFTSYSIEREQVRSPQPKYCAFEYVYYARPDSIINEKSVYDVRVKIGEYLAKESPVDVDVVVGVPETAIPFAMAYSNATGTPIAMGFMRTGRHTRTAIKPTYFERLVGVQLKLNPIKSVFSGKRVLIIDDSVVRGTTMKNVIHLLRNKMGAKEVHVRIGSPRLVNPCPYGTEVPTRDELIAANLSEEEVAIVTGADSFKWLSIDSLIKAIGFPREYLCLRCFGGDGDEGPTHR